jgi:hypothetical protein
LRLRGEERMNLIDMILKYIKPNSSVNPSEEEWVRGYKEARGSSQAYMDEEEKELQACREKLEKEQGFKFNKKGDIIGLPIKKYNNCEGCANCRKEK